MQFRRSLIVVAFSLTVGLAACGSQPAGGDAVIFGRWTPVTTDDCGPGGIVITMRKSGVFGMTGGGLNEAVGKIVGHTQVDDDTIDLSYRQIIRTMSGAKALEDTPRALRFAVLNPDRIRAISDSNDGRNFAALSSTMTEAFDLRRCE
ncbi:hypothetical protein [Brevundimonas sp.]|uniref:hypothetical protein n=1 Tax=Brevundimonas sp. TaxID=1871086 RepID=UPI0035AE594C